VNDNPTDPTNPATVLDFAAQQAFDGVANPFGGVPSPVIPSGDTAGTGTNPVPAVPGSSGALPPPAAGGSPASVPPPSSVPVPPASGPIPPASGIPICTACTNSRGDCFEPFRSISGSDRERQSHRRDRCSRTS
jgi:hypothetical protein